MKKRTREKIALIVFIVLVLLAAIILIGYFATGRSWTRAASFVDDMAGRMDGYTVLVYSGTVEQLEVVEPNSGDEDPGFTLAKPSQNEEDSSNDDTSVADSIGLAISSLLPRIVSDEQESVYVSDVRDLYERKGAEVLSLDADDLGNYYTPQVLYAGEKSIGVFSIDYYATRSLLDRIMAYFDEKDVDAVVCLTTRTNLLATYEGIDVAIVTTDADDISTSGKTVGATLMVRSPEQGEVGVIVLSSNDVPSAKVINAL